MNIQERDACHITGIKQSIIKVEFEQGRVTYSPLHLLIQKNDLSAYFRKNQTYANHPNMRGYVCEWELINNMLYLISFKSASLILQKISQLFQNNLSLDNLNPVKDSTGLYLSEDKSKCVANWFSGNLFVSSDDLKKSLQIKGIKYTFDNGTLTHYMAFDKFDL